MRILALALLLSVPLSAGDEASLAKAVALFKSPHAAQREAGSQLADRELRKLLAPLLEAMKDNDPEVRRRARRSILSLVPGEVEKDARGTKPQTRGRAVLLALKDRRKMERALQGFMKGEAERGQKGRQLMGGFGIKGRTRRQAPLMPGLSVAQVREESPAARIGVRTGDLVVRVNGTAVTRVGDFPRALGDKPDWSRITVTVLRDGKYVRLPQK
jgi:C-terminal processing protease CtpA/Prc